MRGLRIALTILFTVGLGLLLCTPWVLAMRPVPTADPAAKKQFAWILTSYISSLFLIFAGVLALSWRLMRRQQEKFLEESRKNLETLIEGTLSDHERGR